MMTLSVVTRLPRRRHQGALLASLALGLLLAACGGGGDSSTASAGTSTTTGTTPGTGATTPTTPIATTSTGTVTGTNTTPVTSSTTTVTPTSSTAGVQCSSSVSVFNSSASVRATSTASWTCSSTRRVLAANGLPDHDVGTFPNANNPNTITAQNVSANMALVPVATAATARTVGGVGYAFNGVKLDPATAGACAVNGAGTTCSLIGNAGNWNIEALGQSSFNFGVDANNAHVQPDGTYHYHGMPEGVLAKLNKGQTMTLVGFALDGYPVYARYGYSVATSAASAIKVLKASYQLKAVADTGRPSTATYPMGAFTQDYQYVAGSGDLDECNGRTGVTPEFPGGFYHYVITDTYPFIGRCLKGALN